VYSVEHLPLRGNESLDRSGLSLAPSLTVALDIGLGDGFHIVPEIGAQTFIGSDSFNYSDDTVRLRAALGFYF
jgi:hypothetical protein